MFKYGDVLFCPMLLGVVNHNPGFDANTEDYLFALMVSYRKHGKRALLVQYDA